MGKLIYKKMSLFDAPKGSVIVHASNAQGVWGSGIAKEFNRRYPAAYRQYADICEKYDPVGKFLIFPVAGDGGFHMVATLVTSKNYGAKVDSPAQILHNTKSALDDMLTFSIFDGEYVEEVYSNKFNSGLFKVPWEDTAKLLEEFCAKNNINWIVCDPDLP